MEILNEITEFVRIIWDMFLYIFANKNSAKTSKLMRALANYYGVSMYEEFKTKDGYLRRFTPKGVESSEDNSETWNYKTVHIVLDHDEDK